MDYVILGGDERFACLAALLERRGESVCRVPARSGMAGLEALAEARNVVANDPPKLGRGGPDIDEVVARMPHEAALWLCGPERYGGLPEDRRVVDLWSDERLILDNAALTAEGALSAAMAASRRSLRELPALVIGWGRIGRALAELLVGMGAQVRVTSRDAAHRGQALARGAEAADTEDIASALKGRRLIFNTAPAMVLDGESLRHVERDALMIDLASPPYGIDLSAAWGMGLRAWREPGLPGRYCPESAAAALLRAMDRSGEGRN